VMKWGVQSRGLITTDSYRIGAQDQLRVYGKILGVPVYTAHTTAELQSMLGLLAARKLILIDTVGMGQRDSRVPEQLAMLSDPIIQRILVLNAAAQPEMLEDVARSYGAGASSQHGHRLSGAIISKLDEAVKVGGVLDTVMRHKLKLHFLCHVQRVPEDMSVPNATALLKRALQRPENPLFSLQTEELGLRMMESNTLRDPLSEQFSQTGFDG
jgi:flagellar biosynthesis protein FlhF